MKSIEKVDIEGLLSATTGIKRQNLYELIISDRAEDLFVVDNDSSICFYLESTLFSNDNLLYFISKLKALLLAKGYSNHIAEYDYDEESSYFINDTFGRSFLPKNLWFIHDNNYPMIKKNLEQIVLFSAYKNIYKIAHKNNELSTLVGLPTVTVVITNYNYEEYLESCIQSVIDINYPYVQRIIVDDVSTDNSSKIIDKYKDSFEVVKHSKNSGQLAAFFSAVDMAKGEFIVFVDADDSLDFDAINNHLSVHLYSKPYVSFTCGRNRQIGANGTILSDYHMDLQTNSEKIKYVRPRFIHTPTWSWSTTSAMMFRTDMLRLIKTDNTDAFRVCADYYVVNFSNLLGASMLIDTVVSSYRRHGKNNFSKNFIIGGHKPTGHMKYHAHPEHSILINEIISKFIDEREKIEPYFGSLAHYCIILSYAMPVNELLKIKRLPKDIYGYLKENKRSINWELKKQKLKIQIKNWYAKKSCFLKSLKSFKDFYNLTYCEK